MHSEDSLRQYGLLLKAARFELEGSLEKEARLRSILAGGANKLKRMVRLDPASTQARQLGRQARADARGAKRINKQTATTEADRAKVQAAQARADAALAQKAEASANNFRAEIAPRAAAARATPSVTSTPTRSATPAPAPAADVATGPAPRSGPGLGYMALGAGGVGAAGYGGHAMGQRKGEEAGKKNRNLAFGAGVATGAVGGPMVRQLGQSLQGPPPQHMMY